MIKKKVKDLPPEIAALEDRLKKHLKWEFMVAESMMRKDWKEDIKKDTNEKFEKVLNEITNIKDEIMGELKTVREEQELLSSQHGRILDLEDEIEILKKIHQQNSHPPLVA